MANVAAWDQGYATGQGIAQQQRAHKQAMSDLEFQTNLGQIQKSIGNLQTKLSTLDPSSPDYASAKENLTRAVKAKIDLFHPDKNPGALSKFGHLLHIGPKVQTQTAPQRITATKQGGTEGGTVDLGPHDHPSFPAGSPVTVKGPAPATPDNTIVPNPKGLVEPGNINIWSRPLVQNADGTHSTEYSVSFKDGQGREVLVPTVVNGKFLTPDGKKPQEGSPEEQAMFKAAWDHYLKTKEHLGIFDNAENANEYASTLHTRGPKASLQVLKAWAEYLKNGGHQRQEEITTNPQDTPVPGGDASSPMTMSAQPAYRAPSAGPAQEPGQYAPGTRHQLKEREKKLQQAQDEAGQIAAGAPLSTAQEYVQQMRAKMAEIDDSRLSPEVKAEAIRRLFNVYAKPTLEKYTLPDGSVQYFDASAPDSIPEGAQAYVKQDAGSINLAEYNNAVAGGYAGSFPQWMAEQKSRGSVPRAVWGKDEAGRFYSVNLDRSTNQEIPGTRNYSAVPPTSLVGRITMGHYHWTDPLTGAVHDQPQTGYSGPAGGGPRTPSQPYPPSVTSGASGEQPKSSPKPPAQHAAHAPSTKNLTPSGVWKDTVIGFKGTKDAVDTQTALEAAKDRVETMEENLRDATSDSDNQQAMLSLLANHIGMTLGAQKGARINQAVWNEAVSSAPWAEAMYAKMFHFDADTGEYVLDGWKGGVTLTPEQMKQMVDLAHQKEKTLEHHMERINKERQAALHPGTTEPDKDEENKKQWPKAPPIGTVEDGHRYKGGNPHDESNWEKVN